MNKIVILIISIFLLYAGSLSSQNENETKIMNQKGFYNLSAISIDGEEISMAQYKGKVILVVNTASDCGFTPQYEGLEKLYQEYKDQGLVILGFPCNQFGKQEPGTDQDIKQFCSLNYGVSFQMFAKIDVNGENMHPIYRYLKAQKGGFFGKKIKWNFSKFLLDRNGQVVDRFGSATKPSSLEDDIKKLL